MSAEVTTIVDSAPGGSGFPGATSQKSSSPDAISEALAELCANKGRWVKADIDERIVLLQKVLANLHDVADTWVESNVAARRAQHNDIAEMEEWFMFSALPRFVRLSLRNLEQIRSDGQPRVPGGFRREGEQLIASIVPASLMDRMTMPGISVEVWLEKGADEQETIAAQAAAYKDGDRGGKVALVLAAGNASHLPGVDILSKLFGELEVVVCKINPVSESWGRLYEQALSPLIEANILRIVYGGADVGQRLVASAEVESLALTGSRATYDAIVFGTGEEAERRRQTRELLCEKPFRAELDNVTPVIVVPGEWSDKELRRQAQQIAGWQTLLAGYGCMTPRVLITHKEWPLRGAFMTAFRQALASVPTRHPWYPGTRERVERFQEHYGDRYESHGVPNDEELAWGYIDDVDPAGDLRLGFEQETFCGVSLGVTLSASNPAAFIETATRFCNESLYGTLAAIVVVSPREEASMADSLRQSVRDLDYGTVFFNLYPGQGHALASAPWGGAPGRDAVDPGSGIGFNNDPFLFGNAAKTVMKAPFMKTYDPLVSPRGRVAFGEAFGAYNLKPSFWNFNRLGMRIAMNLMRGWGSRYAA